MSKKQSWLLLGGIILASCVFSLVIQLLGVEGNARSIAITFWMGPWWSSMPMSPLLPAARP